MRRATLAPDRENGNGWWIDVEFDHVAGALRAEGRPNGFAVVDLEGRDLNAIFKTTLRGSGVRLHANIPVVENMFLHHGFGTFPYCNITDARDESLPVFGPLALTRPIAGLPYITTWKTSGIITDAPPLAEIGAPGAEVDSAPVRTWPDGFINQHDQWMGNSGLGYFAAKMVLPEPMRLKFRLGYDGPFRLWLNRELFFEDLAGTNPCTPDQSFKLASLPAGEHDLRVAMDLNSGPRLGLLPALRTQGREANANQRGFLSSSELQRLANHGIH